MQPNVKHDLLLEKKIRCPEYKIEMSKRNFPPAE